MPAALATDYALARATAEALANAPALGLAAVLLGGVGDDWLRAPVYPYAVVAPTEAETARGSTTRTVRVLLVVRDDPAATKPDPATGGILVVGSGAALDALVAGCRDLFAGAPPAALGAPLASIATSYDAEPAPPVARAELLLAFEDPQAFSDAF